MKFRPNNPPRRFPVGQHSDISIQDCGEVELEPDELVTLGTESGLRHDVCRKDFGFYITQSLNHRVRQNGFRAALMKNDSNRYYIVLVEIGKEDKFDRYLRMERNELVSWMDNDVDLNSFSVFKENIRQNKNSTI